MVFKPKLIGQNVTLSYTFVYSLYWITICYLFNGHDNYLNEKNTMMLVKNEK